MSYENDRNNINLIVNSDYFYEFHTILCCIICHGFVIDPKECLDCNSNFCTTCIDEWEEKGSDGGCPKKCGGESYETPNRYFSLISEKLIIRCPMCDVHLNYNRYQNHYDHECQRKKVPCFNLDCKELMEKINLPEHLKNCGFSEVTCEECGGKTHRNKTTNVIQTLRKKLGNKKKKIIRMTKDKFQSRLKIKLFEKEVKELKKQVLTVKRKYKKLNERAGHLSKTSENSFNQKFNMFINKKNPLESKNSFSKRCPHHHTSAILNSGFNPNFDKMDYNLENLLLPEDFRITVCKMCLFKK
jgi:hypothetical protein